MEDIGVPTKWERLGETKWYKVETSTKQVYYYNRASKESRWERPDVGFPEPSPEEHSAPTPATATAPVECTDDDIAGYKALIRELKLPPNANFNSALPRLVFDDRFKRIPQSQRGRLFDKLRRELLKESSRSLREISKDLMTNEETPASSIVAKTTVQAPSKEQPQESTIEDKGPDEADSSGRKRGPPISDDRQHRASTTRPRTLHLERSREEMATDMARTAFLSLLHEKVKMPFTEGEIEPLDESLVSGDPRNESQFLRDRERIYMEFVSDFLVSRVALFSEKLHSLTSDHLNTPLEEVIQILDPRLFEQLPRDHLYESLHRWRQDTKRELVDSFKFLLRQTLCYAEGTPEENLSRAKQQLRHDKRYQRLDCIPDERDKLLLRRLRELEDIHRNSRIESSE